jgi:hypothetical protein
MDLVAKVPRGGTYYGGETIPTTFEGPSVNAEGHEHMFDDIAAGQTGVVVQRSAGKVKAILVRNATAATVLQAGDVVVWKAGYRKRRVGALTSVAGEAVAGVVDDHIPSGGVRVGDLFWLIVKGNCNCDKATGVVISEGERVITNNAGAVTEIGAPASDTAAQNTAINCMGSAFADAASDDTKVVVDLDIRC